jgi:hypothetical protein
MWLIFRRLNLSNYTRVGKPANSLNYQAITVKIIFYHYYLFYKNILGETEPKSVAAFVISFCETLLVSFLIGVVLAHFCIELTKLVIFSVFGISLLFNFLFVFSPKKADQIVNAKPKLYGSHSLSVLLTILFSLISFATVYLIAFYLKDLLKHCQ